MNFTMIFVFSVFATMPAWAACEFVTHRTVCAGKEDVALKPYGGKNPTTENGKSTSAEDCSKEAEKAAKIVRKGVLSKKSVTAKFDGKDIGHFNDEKACK